MDPLYETSRDHSHTQFTIMETEYNHICPSCSKDCTVPGSMTGQNVVCPNCSIEFLATPPEPEQFPPPIPQDAQSPVTVPKKLPFFKSGRKKILEERFSQLAADGEIDKNDDRELTYLAASLGLDQSEVSKMQKEKFTQEFEPIKRRMESTFLMTDGDLEEIKRIERKYDVRVTLEGNSEMFRAIYLMESGGHLPPPIFTDIMLDSKEVAYCWIPSTWHQTRVKTRGYYGSSVSVPTGIKGVRFRFGGYSPVRSEEMTPLSRGNLYVTSKRPLFKGDSRNTTISLKKIVDGHVFSDSLKVEKETGKPDLFTMDAPRARYILALIGALK